VTRLWTPGGYKEVPGDGTPEGDFEKVTSDVAAKNCSNRRRGQKRIRRCSACKNKVIIHCDDCRLQISGCYCTDVARYGEEEAKRRLGLRNSNANPGR